MHLSIPLYKYGNVNSNFSSRYIVNILLKQVFEWYDFVFLENVTSRRWAYLFTSEFIKWHSAHSDLFLKFEFNS